MTKSPIGIIAFSRPDLLAQVLESLKHQEGDSLEGREIHLFQDGAVNRYSGLRRARDEDIEACVSAFRTHFPDGVVHSYDHNIGICENFDRAENYFFDERKFDCALFFEDDMILSPVYLRMMDQLENRARELGHVAYFAAYGDYYDPPPHESEHYNAIIEMDHHWAFGLFAHARAQIRRYIEPYLELVYGVDYSRRNHRAIYEMYRQRRSCPDATSQDAAKAHACAQLGYWRCRTAAPFARYVGSEGQHMTKEHYDQLGFDRVAAAQKIIKAEWPNGRRIQDYIIEKRNLYYANYYDRIEQFVEASNILFSPLRLCTEADVNDSYRLLLSRMPENDDIVSTHRNKTPVFSLIRSILNSEEFISLCSRASEPNTDNILANHDDVRRLYNLILQREPESAALVQNRANKYPPLSIVRNMITTPEYIDLYNAISF